MKNNFPSLTRRCSIMLLMLGIAGSSPYLGMNAFATSPSVPGVTQSRNVILRGTIIDEAGETVPGAAIQVVGTPRGVTTDMDGTFSIEVPRGAKLEITYLGMESQTITVGDKNNLKIILKQKVDELDEVTVVAFAKQKKESVLASVSTIKPAELKAPTSNLTTALAGRVAGLISYQRSGEPGADNADFFVRGVTTFGYAKSPLILVDDVEMESEDLARLQVDDIASFSIMKDATATALYGARGANGVILVTTKQGTEGPSKISARFETSISAPTKEVKWTDPITYMNMFNEAITTRDPSSPARYSQQKIDNTIAGLNPNVFPAVDWYDMLLKNHTTNLRGNLNLSGGGKVARYYVAGSLSHDSGIFKNAKANGFDNNISLFKYLLRSNVDINVSKTTLVRVRLQATMDDYTGPVHSGSDLYKMISQSSPVEYPAYYQPDKANETTPYILFGGSDKTFINPYAELMKGYQDRQNSTIFAQMELEQDLNFIAKGLKLRGMFNTNRKTNYSINRTYNPYYFTAGGYNPSLDTYYLTCLNPATGTDYLSVGNENKEVINSTYFQGTLTYNKTFNKKHAVSGLLVYYLRDEKNSKKTGSIQLSLPYRNMGLSGRFTYAFDDRYFFEGNFGYNGSERFSQKERYGFFPSAGLGYIISNEPFYPESLKKVFNKMKLKATFGLVGNDQIGAKDDRFYYRSEVNLNNGSYGYTWGNDYTGLHSVNGVSIIRYANDDITWETSRKTNLGIELGIFNDLELQVDVYRDYRYNILMSRASLPGSMGLQAAIKSNLGEAISQGIDISLDYNHAFKNGAYLQGRANLTWASGKYRVYEEPDYSKTPWLSRIDQKLSQAWGYVAERLFIDDNEVYNSPTQFGDYRGGDIKYTDINGDGQITTLDRVPLGYPNESPEIVYGFGLTFGWKGFDLSCFFQGSARESFWMDYNVMHPFTGAGSGTHVMQAIADSYWSERNQDVYAFWPRLSSTISSNNSQTSTWFMRDGSFLRLKSVEFGYTLPKSVLKKLHMNSIRIYYSGTNLLCFSKFDTWDPEMTSMDKGFKYPLQRVNNIGINFSF
ncbi:SusC/RagA family TonB-linked outer membrane protein [Bacteroides salyersiae]|uniref:SusC/RagA family TonB-linked outer membrane protein n=1 Tax=Bacteroides salyersiae TaxID=291644 RepID=UPI001C8C1114|nr:TonB-dependent receptor [Bacteroides salyersiae]